MTGLRTHAAASMLGVSPSTLRSWERRFGFPMPGRSDGGHRQYELRDIEALRQAFLETHNASSAVTVARQRGQGPASDVRLAVALAAFDEPAADRLLEESLAVRPVERTVEDVLLPAVAGLEADAPGSAEHAFAWRHATGWLAAQRRLAPPGFRPESVLLFDASLPCDLEALGVQALELALRRVGVRTLGLNAALDPARLGRALRELRPDAVVLAGNRASREATGRLVHAVRGAAPGVEVFGLGGFGRSTAHRLGPDAVAARDALLAVLARTSRGPDA